MGTIIAITIISLWTTNLLHSLIFVKPNISDIMTYLFIALQTYLYTGLFITAHDAMHRTVSSNRRINDWIGKISSFLYAAMNYNKLVKNHLDHHKYPGEEKDPDFNVKTQNFFIWYFSFMFRYATLTQIVIMGIIFNVLKYFFSTESIVAFWIIPAFLSSLQLFYFGTYKPHKKPHTEDMKPHNSRSLKKNHFIAMLSCYFFGYHWEHHENPRIPWWQLWKEKENKLKFS